MRRSYPIILLACFLLTLNGCSAVKKCKEPQLDLPGSIVAGQTDTLTMADIEWWTFYGDSLLCNIIQRTLDNNKNILAAAARVEQMREMYRISKANLLPSLDATMAVDNETNHYNGEKFKRDSEFDLKASLSWEADLWGNLRWAKRKTQAQWLASVEAQRAMRMTLIAEAATAYFRLVALDNELAIVRRTLSTRQEGVAKAKLRFEGGLTSELVYQQALVEYATTATLLPELENRVEVTEGAIALLMGAYPGEQIRRQAFDFSPLGDDELPIGIPSQLLLRRPDVRAVEQQLKAAMSEVGISYTDRFPRLTFNLQGGLENDELDGFFKSPFSYMIGKIISPLFDFGRKQSKYRASVAAYEAARLDYEQKVLEVFKETKDAVSTYQNIRKTTVLKSQSWNATKKYIELAELQYRSGSINYIDVLDAQRRYFDAQIGLSNAVRDENIALVNLYKSLGGGWNISSININK